MRLSLAAARGIVAGLGCVLTVAAAAPPAFADRYRDAQWHLTSLRVREAQRITDGAGVTVAVIDSGVWSGHPDLKGAVLPGRNMLGNGGNGQTDLKGHGTEMASIIAARGRAGGRGVVGIAPGAEILPVRPNSDTSLVADGINWSVAHGAKVINMSFVVTDSPQLAAAVEAAAAADVVLVAAAGNDGQGGFAGEFPAAYDDVLAVAAVDRKGKAASFSHRGSHVDLAAPGVDIAAADGRLASGYAIADGTSPAAAMVSGAAALIRARFPELSAAEVVQRLTSTAVDKGAPGRDDTYGHGSLDLMAALTAKAPPPSPAPSTAPANSTAVSAPGGDDDDSGLPLLAIGLGALLLAGAALAAIIIVRRSRAA